MIDPATCPRLAQEVQTYHYKVNKNGECDKNEGPVEIDDDGIKAVTYAVEDKSRAKGKPSVLSGTKSDGKKEIINVRREERRLRREAIRDSRMQKKEGVK